MMKPKKRTNMKPEERRKQLVALAQDLFFSKGYEDTSMADILHAASISKGGFYHHFTSKEELLFAVLEGMSKQIAEALQVVAQDTTQTPRDQMITILSMEGSFFQDSNFAAQLNIQHTINEDNNLGLSQRLNRMIHDMTAPILADIIRRGQKDGSLVVQDADAAASLIVYLGRWYDTALIDAYLARHTVRAVEAANHLRAVLKKQFQAFDAVLGLPSGTTHYGWPGMVDALLSIPPAASATGTTDN